MKNRQNTFALIVSLFVTLASPVLAGLNDAASAGLNDAASNEVRSDVLSAHAQVLVAAGFGLDVPFDFPPNQSGIATNSIALRISDSGAPYFESVVYVNIDGQLVPRLVWLSKSSGTWRVAPRRENGSYAKGRGVHYTQETSLPYPLIAHLWAQLNASIAAGTLIDVDVEVLPPIAEADEDAALSGNDMAIDDMTDAFMTVLPAEALPSASAERTATRAPSSVGLSLADTFDPDLVPAEDLRGWSPALAKSVERFLFESNKYDDGGQLAFLQDRSLSPGMMEDVLAVVRSPEFVLSPGLDRLPGFIPDFGDASALVDTFQTSHALLSARTGNPLLYEADITVRVFRGTLNDNHVLWYFCSDRSGRVWVDRIEAEGGLLTSFLTQATFIDSGPLTHKPIEYAHYAGGLVDVRMAVPFVPEYDEELNGVYVDIGRLLYRMLPHQRYRATFFPDAIARDVSADAAQQFGSEPRATPQATPFPVPQESPDRRTMRPIERYFD